LGSGRQDSLRRGTQPRVPGPAQRLRLRRPAPVRSAAVGDGQSAGLGRPPGGGCRPTWPTGGKGGGSRRQGGAALTWMVQVYSLSSSSRTVQLYSRSRLLLLPLINLLSIFPPARPRERRGGAADGGPGAPQPGSSARVPGTCTITLPLLPPLPPAGLTPPLLLLLPSRHQPPPPSPEQAPSSPPRPTALAQLVGRGLSWRGPMGVTRRN
jgi:hypothetical protein